MAFDCKLCGIRVVLNIVNHLKTYVFSYLVLTVISSYFIASVGKCAK